MKFVTCIGATSGLNLIVIEPLFVTIVAMYDFAGSNFATVGILSFVRHCGSDLSTVSLAICASIEAIAASVPPAGLATVFAAAVLADFAAVVCVFGFAGFASSARAAADSVSIAAVRARMATGTRQRMRIPPRG